MKLTDRAWCSYWARHVEDVPWHERDECREAEAVDRCADCEWYEPPLELEVDA